MTVAKKYRMAFVLDQHVGWKTQALNLERVLATDPSVEATLVPVNYVADAGLLTRLPGVPEGIKGTLRGVHEIRAGLGDVRQYDAVFWATWAAKSVLDLVGRAPACVMMDPTPLQMEEMGELYGYTRSRARLLGGWKHRATVQLYAQARHLIPLNEWVAASLRDDYGAPAEKITPISPGVDTGLYRPDPAAKPGDGVVRLLFVGGHFERKGGDLLLRWARETRVTQPWELHVATRDEVSPAPNVVVHRNLANNSPELVRLYQQSDLFALPTRADCYSMVSMEAMASGLPVVVSRMRGIPSIVAEGETGFLIEPDDFATLSARLDQLVTDHALRAAFSEAARRRATAHFDCRVTNQRILEIMKQMCAVPGVGPEQRRDLTGALDAH